MLNIPVFSGPKKHFKKNTIFCNSNLGDEDRKTRCVLPGWGMDVGQQAGPSSVWQRRHLDSGSGAMICHGSTKYHSGPNNVHSRASGIVSNDLEGSDCSWWCWTADDGPPTTAPAAMNSTTLMPKCSSRIVCKPRAYLFINVPAWNCCNSVCHKTSVGPTSACARRVCISSGCHLVKWSN